MRPHSQVAAQKLWGVINELLEAGTNLTIAVRLCLHSSLTMPPCLQGCSWRHCVCSGVPAAAVGWVHAVGCCALSRCGLPPDAPVRLPSASLGR